MSYKLRLLFKFLFTDYNGKFRKSYLFHLSGIFFGSLIIFLTFSIMDGLESEIINKIYSFNYKSSFYIERNRINDINVDYDNIGIESLVHVKGLDFNSVINIIAFSDINKYVDKIKEHLLFENDKYGNSSLIIGKSFAINYNLSIGDTVIINDILFLNPISGSFKSKKYEISNIYNFSFLNHDLNYFYTVYDESFYKRISNKLYIDSNTNYINSTNNIIKYDSLINSIKFEKYLYTILGFITILISSIMIFNNTIILLLEKERQIITLKLLGLNNLINIKLFFNTIMSLIILLLSILSTYFIIYLNTKYGFIDLIFKESPFSIVPMVLYMNKVLISVLIILIFTMCATSLSFRIINKKTYIL